MTSTLLALALLSAAQTTTATLAPAATASTAAPVQTATAAPPALVLEAISSDELVNQMVVARRSFFFALKHRELRRAISGVPEAEAWVDVADRASLRAVIWMWGWLLSGVGLGISLGVVEPKLERLARVPGLETDVLGGRVLEERINPWISVPVVLGLVNIVAAMGMGVDLWSAHRAERNAIDMYNRAVVLEGGAP